MAALERLVELVEATVLFKGIGAGVAKGHLLVLAELRCDGIVGGDSGDVGLGILNNLAILDIEATNFVKGARIGAIVGKELSDNGHPLGRVDGEISSVETLPSEAERVVVAATFVKDLVALVASAGPKARRASVARVRCVGGRLRIGLPYVHLVATGAFGLDVAL